MANLGRRRNNRFPLDSPIQVSWRDNSGNPHCYQAIAIDISDNGIRFELPESVDNTETIQLRSHGLGLACSGSVRTCSRAGTKFVVGIEFKGKARFDRITAGIEPPATRRSATPRMATAKSRD